MSDQTTLELETEQKHLILERLEDQIYWYDRRSLSALRNYRVLKLSQVLLAALIPFSSAFPIPDLQFRWIAAALGFLVLMIEALQQLNQYQQNWIAARSTCEALKHEKYLYLAGAGPYGNTDSIARRLALLAERTEQLVSREHAQWVTSQEHTPWASAQKHAADNIKPVDPWPQKRT